VTPPLRNRREDIPALLNHYLAKSALELGVDQKALTPEALKVLQSFSWPGNVRQLVNACRKLVVLAPGREIRADDISDELGGGSVQARGQSDWVQALQRWAQSSIETADGQTLLAQAGPEFERVLITTALTHARGRRQEAAKLLGWGRNTLTRKIKELGLED
jgi:two-component system, NtrC family, nitrogen regulation response regulator GlnG